MAIVTVGIDLAKNVFAVHGVDETGKATLVRPEVSRGKLVELIASLLPCLPHTSEMTPSPNGLTGKPFDARHVSTMPTAAVQVA